MYVCVFMCVLVINSPLIWLGVQSLFSAMHSLHMWLVPFVVCANAEGVSDWFVLKGIELCPGMSVWSKSATVLSPWRI